jgi:hypothetical protein
MTIHDEKKRTKLVHVGKYIAEVEVNLIVTDDEWSPYLSLADAYKLDDVRQALQEQDITAASQWAQVYELSPIVF